MATTSPDDVVEVDASSGLEGELVYRVAADRTDGDHTWPPYVDMDIERHHGGVSVQLGDLGLTEDACQELIDALTDALADARLRAEKRGYYRWVAAGRP